MTKNTARMLGALAAALCVAYFYFDKLSHAQCPGAVFVEFHPPLVEAGRYRVRLSFEGQTRPCEFQVPLPLSGTVDTSSCHLNLALKTRSRANETAITGLAVGAAPKALDLKITRDTEDIYDAHILPRYSPYPTRREDDKRFCGPQARAQPTCIANSSGCTPFTTNCDGPEDCPKPRVCCASPEWGREYGAKSATECAPSRRNCLDRLALVACHADTDCPSDMHCAAEPVRREFRTPFAVCQYKTK
ncbi:MAG TPA: hypothetical protein VFQ61_27835 [Polyangiaceae bacterium]|nr:hypothetical protein [Polyangiaceae bacterium]